METVAVPPALVPAAEGGAAPPVATPSLLEEPNGSAIDAWINLPHAFVERRIFGIVAGFDRFFADERDVGCVQSNSSVRLRSELRVEEDGTVRLANGVRVSLRLPYIQKRLKRLNILLENAGRSWIASEPRPLSGAETGGRADAVLRLTLFDTIRSSFDLGGGILLDLPPGLVGRLRFRHAHELGRVALARVAASGFWNTRDGFGANGSLAFERALGRSLLLRWTSGTLVSQVSQGFESASELALLATLGRQTGLTVLGAAAGRSKPDLEVQSWRVAARLRTALHRTWIYGEVEPEVAWPLDATGGRRATPAVMFRVEILFEEPPRKSEVAAGSQCGLASSIRTSKGGA